MSRHKRKRSNSTRYARAEMRRRHDDALQRLKAEVSERQSPNGAEQIVPDEEFALPFLEKMRRELGIED